MTRVLRDVYKAALDEAADVYHLHDPELIPVGLRLKAKGKTVIFDAHEDIPKQILAKPWLPKPLRPAVGWGVSQLQKLAARRFDAIVTATPDIKRLFPAEKTTVIRNYPLVSSEELPALEAPPDGADPYVVYVGGLYASRGVEEMVAAGRRLHADGLKFIVAGPIQDAISEAAIRTAERDGVVDYRGRIRHNEVLPLMAGAVAGFVVLHPEPRFLTSYPVKLFEYMAAGTPAIASNFPLFKDIVEGSACGFAVDPLSVDEIVEKVRWLQSHPAEARTMGKNGRAAVLSEYSWEREGERLVQLYRSLVS